MARNIIRLLSLLALPCCRCDTPQIVAVNTDDPDDNDPVNNVPGDNDPELSARVAERGTMSAFQSPK